MTPTLLAGGIAGAGLLAGVLFSSFDDNRDYARQEEDRPRRHHRRRRGSDEDTTAGRLGKWGALFSDESLAGIIGMFAPKNSVPSRFEESKSGRRFRKWGEIGFAVGLGFTLAHGGVKQIAKAGAGGFAGKMSFLNDWLTPASQLLDKGAKRIGFSLSQIAGADADRIPNLLTTSMGLLGGLTANAGIGGAFATMAMGGLEFGGESLGEGIAHKLLGGHKPEFGFSKAQLIPYLKGRALRSGLLYLTGQMAHRAFHTGEKAVESVQEFLSPPEAERQEHRYKPGISFAGMNFRTGTKMDYTDEKPSEREIDEAVARRIVHGRAF